MGKALFFIVFAVLIFVAPLTAQNQEGAVAIADTIVPTNSVAVSNFTTCVASLKQSGATVKEAIKACKEVAKEQAKNVKDVAGKSAHAANANANATGYGYNYGYSYSSPVRRTVVVRSVNRSPRKPFKLNVVKKK